MASRRLDISSLLCDDDQPAFSPLDALVHAATEERRRLDATPSTTTYHPAYPHPQHPEEHRQQLSFRRDEELRRAEYERVQRQREYDQRVREERLREEQHIREMDRQQRERLIELERERERERERELYIVQQQQLRLQQQREQERIDLLARQHRQLPLQPSPHPPSISHLISHSPPPAKKPDPVRTSPLLPIAHIVAPDPISPPSRHDDPRPVKRRRYSESPTRPLTDDKERIARERDKMYAGELGYGRVDSPAAGPSYPAPRRPGSGHGHTHLRKPVSVNDLLVDKDPPRPHSRDTDAHRVVSPLGRRSPPGSQIGRAKAARKSDEFTFREPPPIIHTALEPDAKKLVKDDLKVKQEPNPRTSSFVDEHRPKKPVVKEVAPPPPPPALHKTHSSKTSQDAHEWFLQHYDEDLSPTTSNRPEPPHTPSPSLSPLTPAQPQPPPPPVSVKTFVDSDKPLAPITSAVATLEQELEELVSEPTISNTTTTFVKKQEPDLDMDLDVDLAVTELVDTLESDNVKHDSSSRKMEVDVEDELLSLVQDDRPPPPPAPARRAPGSAGSSSHGSAATPSTTVSTHNANTKPTSTTTLAPPHRSVSEAARQASPPVMSASAGPGPVSGGGVSSASAAAHQTSARPTSERGSMPPPASTSSVGGPAKKTTERAGSVAPAAAPAPKKKKESAAKAAPKAKAAAASSTTAKGRAKSKSKKGAVPDNAASPSSSAAVVAPAPSKAAKTLTGRKTAPSASRSRSASVMPTGSASVGPESDTVKPEKQEEEEDSEEENEDDKDKLYCVCKTKYDEDRVMIACDRCDEWYHTQCVHMPDLEVDLVDQFICPLCVQKNPELDLKTTYKARCLYGLRHPDPSSTKACHKAARGAFSKYCSDECGVKYMQSRIDTWAKKGGKPEKLWESVKNAEKREGVVVCAAEPDTTCVKTETADIKVENTEEGDDVEPPSAKQQQRIVPPMKSKVAQETDRLNALLDSVIKLREEIKKGMEVVIWRERLLKLATERAEAVGQCGWDQRLCLDDEEWEDMGEAVLESYEDSKVADPDVEMEVDNAEEQWWCPGKVVCDRHAGWQAVRHKDVCKEREKNEEALVKLTTREREIRKSIEDMLDPQNTNNPSTATSTTAAKTTAVKETAPNAPLKSSTKAVNGHSKSKGAAATGESLKKGKKRKAPAS